MRINFQGFFMPISPWDQNRHWSVKYTGSTHHTLEQSLVTQPMTEQQTRKTFARCHIQGMPFSRSCPFSWTLSIPWTESLPLNRWILPAWPTSPSFHKLYFWLFDHRQTENGFKLLSDEGRELCHFLLHCADFQKQWKCDSYLTKCYVMTASIKLMTRTINGKLILNKLGRRRVKLSEWWQHCYAVNLIILLSYSWPNAMLLLGISASILLGLGEATH